VRGLRVSKIGVEEGRVRKVQNRWEKGVLSQINAFQEEKENLKKMWWGSELVQRVGFHPGEVVRDQ